MTLSPLTLTKKISDLRTFFAYALAELKAVVEDPAAGLISLARDYKKKGTKNGVHYRPFTNTQLAAIFEPKRFLAASRDPDHFWAPIVAIFLGQRLGEIVTSTMVAIGYDEHMGIWYLDVTAENAKNEHSVRRLPITQGLIDLGFVEYVKHVRALGGTHLFPHRDMTTATAHPRAEQGHERTICGVPGLIGLGRPVAGFCQLPRDCCVRLARRRHFVGGFHADCWARSARACNSQRTHDGPTGAERSSEGLHASGERSNERRVPTAAP